ncbi:MAG: hypothetical protein A2X86_05675 [Bdellovibrionales bacterium GWA2_49_15]|nr:MAG: hypothetical protein A2X86_05675 [Bdellovibrionales bacterium GWA2_49_15]
MKRYNFIFFLTVFFNIAYAEESFNGNIIFSENPISIGSPIAFKAEIILKHDDHIQEIHAINELLKRLNEPNFRFFGFEKIAQSENNADVLEVSGGIVFLNTAAGETEELSIGNGKTQLLLRHPTLKLTETKVVEKPEFYKILLANNSLMYLFGGCLLLLPGGYYLFRKKKKVNKRAQKVLGPNIKNKADVEKLYSYLVEEIKYQEMPISQKMKCNELIKNIDEVQYKRLITSEELARLETKLLEIQKEQNGNRI